MLPRERPDGSANIVFVYWSSTCGSCTTTCHGAMVMLVFLNPYPTQLPASTAILGKDTEAKNATKFNFALFFQRVRNCGCTVRTV